MPGAICGASSQASGSSESRSTLARSSFSSSRLTTRLLLDRPPCNSPENTGSFVDPKRLRCTGCAQHLFGQSLANYPQPNACSCGMSVRLGRSAPLRRHERHAPPSALRCAHPNRMSRQSLDAAHTPLDDVRLTVIHSPYKCKTRYYGPQSRSDHSSWPITPRRLTASSTSPEDVGTRSSSENSLQSIRICLL